MHITCVTLFVYDNVVSLASRFVPCRVRMAWVRVWSCGAVFSCLQWGLPTYLLTYSMVQSPSSKSNWFAASQEIPRISRNPKVHYRTHKRPPPVSILGRPNPVHIPTSHLLEIHPNVIHRKVLLHGIPFRLQWNIK